MASEPNLTNLLAGKQVGDLNDQELRIALISLGQTVGPITGTTRTLYKKKLETLLSPQHRQNQKQQLDEVDGMQTQQQQKYIHREQETVKMFHLQRSPLLSVSKSHDIHYGERTNNNRNNSQGAQGIVTHAQQTLNKASIAATVISDDAEPNLISRAILMVLIAFFVGLFSLYTYSRFQNDIILMQSFKNAFRKIVLMTILSLIGYCAYLFVSNYNKRRHQESAKIYELYGKSLELLQSPDNPRLMPVLHIRDTLMSPNERKTSKMINLWDKTVKFIEENESRVKVELVNIDGEDFRAWKWLGNSTLGGNCRMTPGASHGSSHESKGNNDPSKKPHDIEWQGSALDENEDVVGSMARIENPTKFLKIRNMFDQDTRTTFPDKWKSKVREAILKKCGNIITHMEIDATSDEGLVYAKFDSENSAKQAYYNLHGWWCDKKLVNAKFLMSERYYQRFPEAEGCNTHINSVPQN